jgi:hypothetical protein
VDLFNQIRKKLVIFGHFKDFNICQIKTLLLYHLSFLHALMKFKDIDKISRNLRNALMNGNINIWKESLIFSLVPLDNHNTRSNCPTSVFTGIGQTLMSRPVINMVKKDQHSLKSCIDLFFLNFEVDFTIKWNIVSLQIDMTFKINANKIIWSWNISNEFVAKTDAKT